MALISTKKITSEKRNSIKKTCYFSSRPFLSLFILLSCCFYVSDAWSQKNFIFRVEQEYVEQVVHRIGVLGGSIRAVIDLDNESLISANGLNRVKAQVRRLDGVLGAADDLEFQGIDPATPAVLGTAITSTVPHGTIDDDYYHGLQWAHIALQTADAWEKVRGNGVRVAILDNGIDATHKDLMPNINVELSRSFVPGEDWRIQPGFYFNHGTHVAGIVGAADNGFGIVGVAPEVEIVALKVLSEYTGSGDFSWLMAAIVYAADNEVDIVNISLGALFPNYGSAGKNAIELKKMFDVVGEYATDKGLLLVASSGSEGKNVDECCIYLPSNAKQFLSISSASPVGWLNDPFTSFFNRSTYSNFGANSVDLVAPGGDAAYPGEEKCMLSGLERPCWVFDFVFSTISGGWGWTTHSGTATSHATGVAALYKSLYPNASPEDITHALYASAHKIGADPGSDVVFGKGHVNAAGALSIKKEEKPGEIILDSFTLARTELPTAFELNQNYPNPFNPLTTINFHLPEQSKVYVGVYDVLGRQVATLVNDELDAGCYDTYWNGRDETGNTVESGIYMYKIVANDYTNSKVMTFSNN